MLHIVKKISPVAIGALIGWGYWYFIGCTSGGCPITSKWWTATLYGAVAGASFLIPSRKRPQNPSAPEQNQSHS